MMQADHAGRVDEHVTAALGNIAVRLLQLLAVQNSFQIGPPGFRPPDIPEGSGEHPVATVEFPFFIDQQRPDKAGIFGILPGQKARLKGDHRDCNAKFRQFRFVLPQLREMDAAGQSAEVAVKNQQQPGTLIIGEMMHLPLRVGKREWHRGFSGQIHGMSPLKNHQSSQ